jgi:hypothetical protein
VGYPLAQKFHIGEFDFKRHQFLSWSKNSLDFNGKEKICCLSYANPLLELWTEQPYKSIPHTPTVEVKQFHYQPGRGLRVPGD